MCVKKAIEKLSGMPVIGRVFRRRPRVCVLRLSGVIADGSMRQGGISHARFSRAIENAFKSRPVCVALVLNSPGGSAAQSALIAGHIRALAAEKNIPVCAFIEDVAASGGYWLACAADEIYATDVSITGSIGVISASFGFQDFIARHGVERRLHTSGAEKSFLDPFRTEKPDDVRRLKDIQAALHRSFIDWVKARRAGKLKGAEADLFEGQFWTGQAALENGVIDGIGDLRGMMRAKFGKKVKFVDCGPHRPGWLSVLRGQAALKPSNLPEDFLAALETRAEWSRYGF